MRVLLAVDGSRYSDAAVDQVTSRAWPPISEIRVITAYELPLASSPYTWALPADYFDKVDRAVRERAESIKHAAMLKLSGSLDSSIKITGDITKMAAQMPALFETLSGMPLSELLGKVRQIGDKAPKPGDSPKK